ncbi:MAG: hypothetical protein M1819_002479 [Sarea resinae]|nr:MAG: hypothetical protein M1819_002479 [Sarea resinae]
MFYSETLLSKTGPLARVWLSANLERKLSKTHILQSNIETSVNAIVDQGQAPMALRLSGQLLLGVVRIYSRKARYLLDDCNEALMKIKMAFRPGNVDLPANQLHAPNPATLTLPDALTELDLLAPMPDESLLLTQPSDIELGRGVDLGGPIDWTSQPLTHSIEQDMNAPSEEFLDDDGIVLDLGENDLGPIGDDTSVHIGRREATARPMEEDVVSDDMKFYEGEDLALDIGEGPANEGLGGATGLSEAGGFDFGGDEDMGLGAIGEDDAPTAAPTPARVRDSQSPLSSIRSSAERELEHDILHDSAIFEPEEEEEESLHQAHRAKKRKIIQPDTDTVLHQNQIRQQQDDRSGILKPASFLPRDPMLLTLMSMQRSGGFVSNIFGDARGKGWAPELRNVLSFEVVRQSGDLKRKRDSGVADLSDVDLELGAEKQPQIEIGEDDEVEGVAPLGGIGGDTTLGGEEEMMDLPADDGFQPAFDDDMGTTPQAGLGGEEFTPAPEHFDETTMPLVHPADSGPVAVGTKHAVHLLRERLGPSSAESPSQRTQTSVLFQDLLPEQTTSKADATKMFFEVLVLATKDAVKVEQREDALGGPIRVRGKRGLWGSWAETEAGGEIAQTGAPPASAPVTAAA